MSFRHYLAGAVAAIGLIAAAPAFAAGGMTDGTITVSWQAYALGSYYGGPYTVDIGPGTEVVNLGAFPAENPTMNIDVTDTGATILDIRDGGPFAHIDGGFHGVVFSNYVDSTHALNYFTGVTITSSTWDQISAPSSSRVWFDDTNVYVQFMDTATIAGQQLTLSFDSTPVPEPTSMALLGAGLIGLVGAARRRRA